MVALCDVSAAALSRYSEKYGISKDNLFRDEEEFFTRRRADALVIATQDRDHVRMCIKALALGYDVLLEKPISPVKEELYALLEAHKRYGKKVLVCHVLRYAPAFLKVKEILESGALGKLLCMETAEHVAFWHQAHGFVRGNWRREEDTSPMIMQKCCHDLDLIQYYVGARCNEVYSVGGLDYFKADNRPQGAAERCSDCVYNGNGCPYGTETCYVERWRNAGEPQNTWPYNVCCTDVPLTEEKIRAALAVNGYGKCVFACDNDVVDNQKLQMNFENGVKVSHTMTAFTARSGRRMVFHGTLGEMVFDETEDRLDVYVYGKERKTYIISNIIPDDVKNSFGHGGGDYSLVDEFYEVTVNGAEPSTSIEASIESHLMALAAEESRKSGKAVRVHEQTI